ncbi:class I SAM-dependent methyltransferase [Bradyrhizobium septentrionale]|uniref:Class I SAM-dependent methyltransferase n=1 Tax=Bradyrhizobium septentrionale TaxID=1404411 RepID=A0ABZ2NR29_9BRAD
MIASEVNTKCRHCGEPLSLTFADLGATPVSNDYLSAAQRLGPEPYYPLRAFCCRRCRLVQLEDFLRADDLFRQDYAYFSSISTTWVDHAHRYADAMQARYGLTENSTVVEVASNDGYLLQFFKSKGINVLGVEPCKSVAEWAIQKHAIPTKIMFFGEEAGVRLAREGFAADLTAANNVLAHVPQLNDFVSGFRELLKPEGISTFEFPHLLNLISENQFDTIYHEHFSYLSLTAADAFFLSNGLRVFDVEKLPTHGGSLRVHVCRTGAPHPRQASVDAVLEEEREKGLGEDATYLAFSERVRETKRALLELLISIKREGKTVVGYGAPAKGNTLLNYCGIGSDFLEYTVDRAPQKQGMFLPGTRLPILSPDAIALTKPDYVMILPWNIKGEIMEQMAHIRTWGGKFIVPIPRAAVI